jgi:asparagine synthase (glutamine-hydrolysing)
MTGAMRHRGPDEDGLYEDTHAVLGHTRLSIIDLAEGKQPMHGKKCTVVTFNGEIYNFQELRATLSGNGYEFHTRSDTEVILAGYEAWGVGVVEKLNGMFSFALYDREKHLLLAARDPIGKKPFYYFMSAGGILYFASDLPGLAASCVLPGVISMDGLNLYFSLGYIPAPNTIYKGVEKLQAGQMLIYNRSGIQKRTYWDIDLGQEGPSEEHNAAEKLEEALEKAVKQRLVADVPLGALLSGGIDSNLVVSTMTKVSSSIVQTFTAGFGQKTGLTGTRDERKLAAAAAKQYGVAHEEIEIDSNIDTILSLLVRLAGEPLADSSTIPTYLVCQAARRRVTVALTGDGGDEPFGGYSFRYLPYLAEQSIRKALPKSILTASANILHRLWPAGTGLPRFLRLKSIFRNLSLSTIEAFFMDQAIPLPASSPLNPEFGHNGLAMQRMAELYEKGAGRDDLTRVLYVDARLYMAEDVLVKADRMSMANSLELRAPLLDRDLVQFAFSLPPAMKIRGRECKRLLRMVADNSVYSDLLKQPKTGFSVPVDQYLKGTLKKSFEEYVLAPNRLINDYLNRTRMEETWKRFLNGDMQPLQFIWAIFIFSIWLSDFHYKQTFRP